MPQGEASEEPLEPDVSVEADWNKLQNIEVQFEDYVTCVEGLTTTRTQTVAEIIDTVNQNIDDDDVNVNVDHTVPASFEPAITNKGTKAAINLYELVLKDVVISRIMYSVHCLSLKNN
ncbi:hypothetical protein HHI36_017213 [Cryptolaemus montrouzieri]|uniref:Uncharacterized protein n=1 Tax=Cryptolaemus montrouzieri TaxID=559131 RepID=A0ABD2NMP5_9CUCU